MFRILPDFAVASFISHSLVFDEKRRSYTCSPAPQTKLNETKFWASPSAKQHRNPCSRPLAVYQDLSTRHDWPVERATSSNPSILLGAQNKDLCAHVCDAGYTPVKLMMAIS